MGMTEDTILYNHAPCMGCNRWIPIGIGICPWCQTEEV